MAGSEWGRINAGQVYGIIAADVDRALALAGLREYEQVLVQAVRERSWGASFRRKRADAAPCQLDLVDLAGQIGVPHQRLYEARRRLVKMRILVMDEAGLAINKDAHLWVDPGTGGPLLGPARLVYAASARTRKKADPSSSACTPNREVHSRENVNCMHAKPCNACTPNREVHSRENVNPSVTFSAAVDGSSGPAAGGCVAPHAGADARNSDPTGSEEIQTPSVCIDRPDDTHTGQDVAPHLLPPEDQALVDEAARLADAWFPMRELGAQIARQAGHFNPKLPGSFAAAWLRPALEKLRERPADQWRWSYLRGILRGYAAEGGPPETPAGGSAPARAANPATARRKALSEAIRRMEIPTPKGFGDAR